MTYCTKNDIAARLPMRTLVALTDDTHEQKFVNDAVLNEHIALSCDVIESYLRQRYVLPIDPVPPLLVEIAATLTVFSLFARRPHQHEEPPGLWFERERAARRMLEQMQQGRITLGKPGTGDPDPHAAEVRVNKRGPDRVFTSGLWSRFGR